LFDFRSPVIAWAVPTGLVLAALAWFAFGGFIYGPDISRLEVWVHAPAPAIRALQPIDPAVDVTRIVAAPVFSLTTGPGAVTEPVIQLQGLAVTPKGRAALLSVDGKPANWYELGATRDGVTVIEVQSNHVTVDTAARLRDVGLFDKPVTGAAGSGPAPAQAALPPGFRTPSPASAPSLPR